MVTWRWLGAVPLLSGCVNCTLIGVFDSLELALETDTLAPGDYAFDVVIGEFQEHCVFAVPHDPTAADCELWPQNFADDDPLVFDLWDHWRDAPPPQVDLTLYGNDAVVGRYTERLIWRLRSARGACGTDTVSATANVLLATSADETDGPAQ